MPKSKRIVIKIGSSLLANEELLTPRWAFIQQLLSDVKTLRDQGYEVLICSSGAVALGLSTIGESPETAGLRDKQAAAACGMPILLNAYKQVAHEYSFDIAQVLVTLKDLEDRRRFLNTKNTVHRLIRAGITPIVNENDSITTEEIRVGDNDRLAAKVAQMVQAETLIILTSVDGLYDRNPDEPGAQLVEIVNDVNEFLEVTKSVSSLGTGGMLTKMQAANMAQNSGCTTLIGNGEAENPVTSLLDGSRKHTRCVAHDKPATDWTAWLTDRLQMAGSIVVPAEAAEALCSGERGLLRQDIQSIQGTFVRGDVLHIYDEEGNERARGLANFTAEETIILARNKEIPAKQLLGFQTNATIVSRDNIVVLDGRHIQWDTPPEDELEQIQDT
ncbi:glutamate 5-kinase [Hyphomonas sp.]|uniref:glutamate 5-kinase n=1 Tax=Hyphomonas sp. TaxID=87 RepID=UPI000C580BA8|nr:glutamate 5-kinase [Hyphomonas sp.]MAB11132.1 glutamate 5-kinase [Hyphomonas sp.]MAU67116.1 glutamate 5-kinase [Hyphomonas sp.]MBM57139.1 glutamate 5-kinase [Hyphomonas sp.]